MCLCCLCAFYRPFNAVQSVVDRTLQYLDKDGVYFKLPSADDHNLDQYSLSFVLWFSYRFGLMWYIMGKMQEHILLNIYVVYIHY